MINVELYFNDELADFDNEDTIAGTYAINKLGELKSRQGYYTNTYNLPFSNRNKRIFENAELPHNLSNAPYTLFTHLVKIEGIEVFRGFAKIERSLTSYEVTGFAGNADIFALLKDKSIRDLDLSEFDHVRNDANIEASWTNTDGYIYAYLDYGKYENISDNVVDSADLYPQVYFHTLIEKIVSEAGYSMNGEVLKNSRYKNMVLPWNGDKASRDVSGYIFTGHLDQLNLPPNTTPVIAILTEDEDPKSAYGANGIWVAPINQSVTITIDHTFITDRGASFQLIKRPFTVPSNSSTPNSNDEILAYGAGSDGRGGSFKIKTKVNEGDKIFLTYANLGTFANVAIRVNSFEIKTTSINTTFGVEWVIADNLPDIGQDKLLLEFMIQFCLLPFTDVETQTIRFVFFDDIKKNAPVDWSNKIDDSEPPEIQYRFDEYAQNNTLTYKFDDPDPLDESLITDGQSYVFTIADETLELEQTEYESLFYLPEENVSAGGANTISPKIYKLKELDDEEFPLIFRGKWYASPGDYPKNEVVYHNHKTFKSLDTNSNAGEPGVDIDDWELVDESDVWNIKDKPIIGVLTNGPDLSVQGDGEVLTLNKFVVSDGMTWPEIWAAHYNLFSDVIFKTKIVKHLMKLNYADINQLDHTRTVYLDRYGCYFYCDIVEQFKMNETDSTYVTIIRI